MSKLNRLGNPFPLSHPDFNNDRGLIARIKVFNIYVEMLDEYKHAKQLVAELQDPELAIKLQPFENTNIRMESVLFSHALLEYARSFVASEGSTNLISKQDEIFTDELSYGMHKFLMSLRDKYLAHRQMNISQNQSRFVRHKPEKGDLRLVRDEQRVYLLLHRTVKLPLFERNIEKVMVYLNSTLDSLEASILDSLTENQREYMLNTDNATLKAEHELDDNKSALEPFGVRKKRSLEILSGHPFEE